VLTHAQMVTLVTTYPLCAILNAPLASSEMLHRRLVSRDALILFMLTPPLSYAFPDALLIFTLIYPPKFVYHAAHSVSSETLMIKFVCKPVKMASTQIQKLSSVLPSAP